MTSFPRSVPPLTNCRSLNITTDFCAYVAVIIILVSLSLSTMSSLPFYQAQDPAAFGEEFANKACKVLQTRYRLLPFLYTLFYEAQIDGSTVVRPIMHE